MEKMKDLNNKEELIGWAPTEFSLNQIEQNLKPYADL